jgi:hypothetical protein
METHFSVDLVPDAPVPIRDDDEIGDQAEDQDLHAFLSSGEDLRDGAHAYDVCACRAEQAALVRRLVRGA